MLCLVCKTEIARKNKKYCSPTCYYINHRGFKHTDASRRNMSLAQQKNRRGKNIKCGNCNKIFYVPKKRLNETKYCSKDCYILFISGRPRLKSRKRVDKVCKSCNKNYWVILARNNISNYCSKNCKNIGQSKLLSGKNNPNWHNGIYTKKYGLGWNKLLRAKIRLRDNNTCLNCKKNNIISEIHHIDYNKNNNRELNLATLCKSCHSKTNFNRGCWIKYFKKIMIKKYGESI